MKFKRSRVDAKKSAQEAKQSSKSSPDTAGSGTEAAKMSDAEYDSDSSRNCADNEQCNKPNSSAESISPGSSAPSSLLFKSSSGLKSSSTSPDHADLSLSSPSKWSSATGNGLGMGGIPVSHATLLQQSHHHTHRHPSMVGESFYRHFVS